MAACGSASLWAKIAFVVVVIAAILDIVGIATVVWMIYQTTSTSITVGLWKMKACVVNSCTESTVEDTYKTDTFATAQVFEVMALVLFILLPVVLGLYVYVYSIRGQCMAVTSCCMCFTASLLGFIGMICWVAYIPDPFVAGYSLGLTVLATLLAFIAGLLILPDIIDQDYGGKRF